MALHKRCTPLLIALLLVACSGAATAQPTPAAPTIIPTPAPTLTPTPVPELVLIADADPGFGERLREWAAERGWGFRLVSPQQAASALSDPQVDSQIVVSFEVPIDSELSGPAVLVEVEGATPSERMSTVGTPATHHGEAGFLAGLLAGLTTRVEWVGQLIGTGEAQEAVLLAGYEQGLKIGCPRCRLVSLGLAEASVDGYARQGVDVVFVPPSAEAVPLAAALGEAGVWLVWIGAPPPGVPPESLAGRVGFALEPLLFGALEALAAGEVGQAWPYAIHNGGLVLADINSEAISPGRQRLLDETYRAVANSELDIGLDTPETP